MSIQKFSYSAKSLQKDEIENLEKKLNQKPN